jgi:hypothetical protein
VVLGNLVLNRPPVLNKRLYNSPPLRYVTDPWSHTFCGHRVALLIVQGCRMVGPKFMAAEPDRIDEGRHEDLHLCSHREKIEALILIKGLKPGLQNKVQSSNLRRER